MSKVLIVASGQSAVDVQHYEDRVDYIVVINNAWAVTKKWKYWVRPTDYRGARPNQFKNLQETRIVITPQIYEESLEKYGGYKACGLSIVLNASYWVLDNLKPTAIYYLGADMNYTPDEFGNTHFYGKGYDIQTYGESDPDRMAKKYKKRDPNYLTNVYLRFKSVAEENNCHVYNLSKVENSRLPYPKIDTILNTEQSLVPDKNDTFTTILPNILFLHLSKTAGKALSFSLKANYKNENILEAYIRTGPKRSINETLKYYLQQKHSNEYLKNIKLFIGHCAYGMHEMFEQKFDYVTMVREPVDRIISHYYYSLKTDPQIKLQYNSLEDYVENRSNIHNWMTKRLSNTELGEGDLDLAKQNLKENIAFCGLTEMYEESLKLLSSMYGLTLKNVIKNKNKDRKVIGEVDPKTLQKIKEIHYKDIELYSFAKELFVEKFNKMC